MTNDRISQFLETAHSIIPSLDDFGDEPFTLYERPRFINNEKAAKRSHPDNPQAFLKYLQEFGKIGTLTVSYAILPFLIFGVYVSGYQTVDGAARSFRDLKAERLPQAKSLDLNIGLGDDRFGVERGTDGKTRQLVIQFRLRQFINSLAVVFTPRLHPNQALNGLVSSAHLMDTRTARLIGIDCPLIDKPVWNLSDNSNLK